MNKLRLTQKVLAGSSVVAVSVIMPLSQVSVISAHSYNQPASAPLSAPISTPETSPEPSTEPTNTPDNGNHDSDSHSDNGGSNSGGSSSSSCNAEKPKSAPSLVSWESIGKNQVKLHWTKAQNPVNYYLVNYGLKPHTPIYGNSNVGDQNTTSTVIGGLSVGTTYYFSLEAGNDCVHSASSNEVAIKISGAKLNTQIPVFTPKNVLSASKTVQHNEVKKASHPDQTPVVSNQSQPQEKPTQPDFLSNVAHFIIKLFNH